MTREKELIVIIEYGAGNLFSVEAAVKRLGYTAVVSDDPAVIVRADKVIFPGVGQAKQAMNRLIACGLDRVLPELKVPVLGICLGMQLMCDYSEEGATEGLGIFPIRVKQMTGKVKIPHIGWNRITSLNSPLFQGIEDGAWVYFVHSYYLPVNEYQTAECSYQIPFCAGIRKDNFFGCQFHPEKSGAVGERIIQNFLQTK
jgi:glutamine amidotransferase